VKIALQSCAMELNNSNWIGGLDKSKEHSGGPMAWISQVALDVRPHWRCGQVDYTKNCVVHGWKVLCIGELIAPNGPIS
jgi:hypothetical protein